MTPTELRTRLAALNLTQEAFAAEIGKSDRQVSRYINGQTPIPKAVAMIVMGRKMKAGG